MEIPQSQLYERLGISAIDQYAPELMQVIEGMNEKPKKRGLNQIHFGRPAGFDFDYAQL
ncbi:MAG: hypothetical protein AAFN12_15395 [Cyanobacteria bacterium J06560_2]